MSYKQSAKTLFQIIRKNNQNYCVFVQKWKGSDGKWMSSSQFSLNTQSLLPLQKALFKEAKAIIQNQLDFLPQYAQILTKIESMTLKLDQQIQIKSSNLNDHNYAQKYALDIEAIFQIGVNIQKEGKFLIEDIDLEFLKDLSQKGVSLETLQKFIQQNIRRSIFKNLTDQELGQIGISKLGDKLILRNLMSQT